MSTHHQEIQQLFKGLKCLRHNDSEILQLCISTRCQSDNRLCCLQCVDEKHMGEEHMLISSIKFSRLMGEFHLMQKQKQPINQQLLKWLKSQQQQVNAAVDQYYRFVQQSLVKQNELTSYEEITQLFHKEGNSEQQVSKKLNEIVDCHSWMLEANCVVKQHQKAYCQKENEEHLIKNLKTKYWRLQKRLKEVNSTCEQEIKEVIKKRTAEVKKLFNLFDEIKYNLQDDGNQLLELTPSMSKISIYQSPMKESNQIQEQEKQVKQVFDFMGNIAGGQ